MMQTWIFQGNPDTFDIDGYLATWPNEFRWLVTRYGDEMRPGDRVFLWRNQGKEKAVAGVIAEAVITGLVEPIPEAPEARPFWRVNDDEIDMVSPRALLRLVRVATKKEVLKRDWLEEDPVLRDLPNLKMRAGTNYPVPAELASRLVSLWSRIGQDWSRAEAVAGLWAYVQTYGGSVSKLPGSPVANISMLIARPISGVYNKVMNFRALDPRDERTGFSGAGDASEEVWDEFYDSSTKQLDLIAIQREFERLWQGGNGPEDRTTETATTRETVEATARRFEQESLEDLLRRYQLGRRSRSARPPVRTSTARVFERDPLVVAIARKRAAYRCEVPDCSHPLFSMEDGLLYTEVHHIRPLSDGGEDTIANVACICPAHHREAHHGRDREALARMLQEVRSQVQRTAETGAPPNAGSDLQ